MTHNGINLLRFSVIRNVIEWRGFPYAFQAAMLGVFVWLATWSWDMFAPNGVNPKLFAKTHLTTLLIWGVWWPSMVWFAVLFGRAWCAICPLELVSNFTERLARQLHIPQRPVRKWMASGVLILLLYAFIQLFVAGAHINRVPAYTSFFLIGLLFMAILTALIYKDRAFCRAFCPVGLLLGTYGRGGMLALRTGPVTNCNACTGKDCIVACNRTRLDARSCPSLLNPPKLNSNRDCLVCGQCIKACLPDNMQLLLRRPFPISDARETFASWPVTLFVMLASGFVIWELFTEWPASEELFLALPAWISQQIPFSDFEGWLVGVWALAVVPLALWSALAWLTRLFGGKEQVQTLWRRMALPVAVVVSAGHMSKGLAKWVSWTPFLPGALQDPVTVNATTPVDAKASLPPLVDLSTVAAIALILVSMSFFYACREYRLAHPADHRKWIHYFPIVSFALLFVCQIFGWILQ